MKETPPFDDGCGVGWLWDASTISGGKDGMP
jgi:hypothetical protein